MGRYHKKQQQKQEGKVIGVEEDTHGGLLSRVKIETQLQVQMDLASHVQIMQRGLNFKFVLLFYNSTSKHCWRKGEVVGGCWRQLAYGRDGGPLKGLIKWQQLNSGLAEHPPGQNWLLLLLRCYV